jgi:hypothetical protein
MKNDVMPSRVQMEADVLKSLLTEVKETVAKDFAIKQSAKRKFNTTDLWNIQRNSKLSNGMFKRRFIVVR